jgi:RHS repeat-associated protein
VFARNVEYLYDNASEPEEVTSLVSASDHTTAQRSYAYDAIGNETLRCNGALVNGVCGGESFAFLYDGKDQLRRVTHVSAAGTTLGSEEYWYDSNGIRMATVKRDGSGNKTELIYFVGGYEGHYDGNGAIQHAYSHVSLGTPVARVDRTSNTTTNIEFQFHGVGISTLAAVDQSGTVNASFSYAPFGETIESVDGGGSEGVAAHRRRLNDKFVDEISDLAYYGARFYDKTSMSWTQGDPRYRFAPDARWIAPRRGSLYQFSLNNPLRYTDPDGHDIYPSHNTAPPCATLGCAIDTGPAAYDNNKGWLSGEHGVGSSGPMDCGGSAPGICDPNQAQQPTLAEALSAAFGVNVTYAGGVGEAMWQSEVEDFERKAKGLPPEESSYLKAAVELVVVPLAILGGVGLVADLVVGGGAATAATVGTTGTGVVAAASKFPFQGFVEWGHRVWGVGTEGARAALQNMTVEIASKLDPAEVRAALQFYQRAVELGKGGATAPVRVELMQTILRLQGQ